MVAPNVCRRRNAREARRLARVSSRRGPVWTLDPARPCRQTWLGLVDGPPGPTERDHDAHARDRRAGIGGMDEWDACVRG